MGDTDNTSAALALGPTHRPSTELRLSKPVSWETLTTLALALGLRY
jgi:hypothetical protein